MFRSAYCLRAFLFLLTLITAAIAEESPEFKILKSIKAPQDLLFPHFPPRYCARAHLSGDVAEEMVTAIKNLQLESPFFREYFDGKEFHLYLANSNYPEQTRELLSGLLNPLELINMAVESVIKYKSEKGFAELREQAAATHEISDTDGRSVYRIKLTPRKEYFGYSYNDNGAYIDESWLKELTVVVDSSSGLVYEIDARRQDRHYTVEATEKPAAREIILKYVFSYEIRNGIPLPSEMSFFTNDEPVLEIKALYGEFGKETVFTRKTICVQQESQKSCLDIGYTDFKGKACPSSKKRDTKIYNRKLEKAALLSKKAADLLRNGNISSSTSVLEELIEKYGDTPQAVEARRLLAKLPPQLR
jgi:hypothetical protein